MYFLYNGMEMGFYFIVYLLWCKWTLLIKNLQKAIYCSWITWLVEIIWQRPYTIVVSTSFFHITVKASPRSFHSKWISKHLYPFYHQRLSKSLKWQKYKGEKIHPCFASRHSPFSYKLVPVPYPYFQPVPRANTTIFPFPRLALIHKIIEFLYLIPLFPPINSFRIQRPRDQYVKS